MQLSGCISSNCLVSQRVTKLQVLALAATCYSLSSTSPSLQSQASPLCFSRIHSCRRIMAPLKLALVAASAAALAPASTPLVSRKLALQEFGIAAAGVLAGASAAADAATRASLRGAMMRLQLWMREKHRRQRLCLYVVDDARCW